jgi:hypothetical protein
VQSQGLEYYSPTGGSRSKPFLIRRSLVDGARVFGGEHLIRTLSELFRHWQILKTMRGCDRMEANNEVMSRTFVGCRQ